MPINKKGQRRQLDLYARRFYALSHIRLICNYSKAFVALTEYLGYTVDYLDNTYYNITVGYGHYAFVQLNYINKLQINI